MRPVSRFMVSFLAITCPLGQSAQCDDDEMARAAVTAWENRQHRIRSLRVRWTEEVTVEAGFWADPETDGVETKQPDSDVFYSQTIQMVMDGPLVRIEADGFGWSHKKGLVPTSSISVFDGRVFTRYFRKNNADWPDAVIEEQKSNVDARAIEYLPVVMLSRLMDSEVGTLQERPRFLRRGMVGADECVILDGSVTSSHVREFWACPGKEFLIRRFQILKRTSRGVEVNDQMDIEYSQSSPGEWTPANWRYTFNCIADLPKYYATGEVELVEINPTVARSEFERPDFTAGTWVLRDETSPHHGWIALEGGERRPILENEREASYHELRNSKPGQAFAARGKPVGPTSHLATYLTAILTLLSAIAIRYLFLIRRQLQRGD